MKQKLCFVTLRCPQLSDFRLSFWPICLNSMSLKWISWKNVSFVVEDLSKNLVVFLHSLHRCCGTEGEHISLLVGHLSLVFKLNSFSVFITYFILYGANINCIESAAWLVIRGLQSQAAKLQFCFSVEAFCVSGGDTLFCICSFLVAAITHAPYPLFIYLSQTNCWCWYQKKKYAACLTDGTTTVKCRENCNRKAIVYLYLTFLISGFLFICLLFVFQVELTGHSIFDFTHPCDHEEIRENLSLKTTG